MALSVDFWVFLKHHQAPGQPCVRGYEKSAPCLLSLTCQARWMCSPSWPSCTKSRFILVIQCMQLKFNLNKISNVTDIVTLRKQVKHILQTSDLSPWVQNKYKRI